MKTGVPIRTFIGDSTCGGETGETSSLRAEFSDYAFHFGTAHRDPDRLALLG